ncbi:MAG: SIMPL domain-containing protein [Elainellaceae cyanobacterium]
MTNHNQPQFLTRLASRHYWKPLAILVAAPIATAVLAYATLTPAFAQERQLRTLSVTGQSTERIETTLAQVSLGVDVRAETATEAQQEAAQRSEAVVAYLRSRGVDRLQTTGVSLQPNYSYQNDEQRIIGYIATNIVSFRASVDEAGSILDDAVDAGATRIDGISFTATDEAIAAAQRQALRTATEDAQAQADTVLDVLGLRAQDIIGIQIDHSNPLPSPLLRMEAQAFRNDAANTPIVGGEQDVDASVTLHIQY